MLLTDAEEFKSIIAEMGLEELDNLDPPMIIGDYGIITLRSVLSILTAIATMVIRTYIMKWNLRIP
jgi:hypothetical protein